MTGGDVSIHDQGATSIPGGARPYPAHKRRPQSGPARTSLLHTSPAAAFEEALVPHPSAGRSRPGAAAPTRGRGARNRAVAIVLALGALGAGLLLSSATALAGEGYGVSGTFGSAGSGAGQFSGPEGVAVGQGSGEVFVVDQGNNRVERFSGAGVFERQFNGSEIDGVPAASKAPAPFSSPRDVAVDDSCFYAHLSGSECTSSDPSNGDVYVSDLGHGVVDKLTGEGEYVSQLGPFPSAIAGVAVDAAGNVWVYEESGNVTKYGPTGAQIEQFNTGRGTAPGLAVDSSDDTYLAFGCGCLGRYDASGEQQLAGETEAISGVSALTVDLATNDLFVGLGSSLAQYGPFGEPFSAPLHGSGAHVVQTGGGIAVDSSTHAVYRADSAGGDVAVLTLGPTPPAPKTDAQSEVRYSRATLNGDLNPEGVAGGLDFYFSYNTGASCTGPASATTPLDNGGSSAAGSSSVSESATVTGLQPSTEYAFCFVAENGNGPTYGPAVTFTTASTLQAFAPTVDGESAANVTPFDAMLEARVTPENQASSWHFELAEKASGQTLESPESVGSGTLAGSLEEQAISANIDHTVGGELKPASTYYYRVFVSNASGSIEGPVQSFQTLVAQKPAIEGESASEVTQTEALLDATVNPEEQALSCEFQYSTEPGIGGTPAVMPCIQSPKDEVQEINADGFEGAALGVEGHGLVGSLAPGMEAGEVQQLLDGPYGEGNVEVSGGPAGTKPLFVKSIGALAGEKVPSVEVSGSRYISTRVVEAGNPSVSASVDLTELQPNTEYHYQVLVTNATGTTEGLVAQGDQTFLTLPNPPAVKTGGASNVRAYSATITGEVNPGASGYPTQDSTTYWFQYSVDTSYDIQVPLPHGVVAEGTSPVTESAQLSSLAPDTTYHYRLVASNDNHETFPEPITHQISYGEGKEFTTPPTPPVLGETSISGITTSGAGIGSSLNAEGLLTLYSLRLGTDKGALLAVASGRTSANSAEPITFTVSSLLPGTTYYYQLIAQNADGTVQSPEGSFTTMPTPVVQTQPERSFPQVELLGVPPNAFPPIEGTVVVRKQTPAGRCPKGKRRSHGRCVKTKRKHKAKKGKGKR